MSHLHRFYLPTPAPADGVVALPQEEAHHALKVLRVRPGDAVVLFDGLGREWPGAVAAATRHDVQVSITEARLTQPPPWALTLCVAWLKREKALEFTVRHGTEMGVTRFLFWRARHSERSGPVDDKWRRLAIETCKQCGRPWLPEFAACNDLEAALNGTRGTVLAALLERTPVPLAQAVGTNEASLVVGPEGDFTPAERDLLEQRRVVPISLGPSTFRSEMAAVVGAAAMMLYRILG